MKCLSLNVDGGGGMAMPRFPDGAIQLLRHALGVGGSTHFS